MLALPHEILLLIFDHLIQEPDPLEISVSLYAFYNVLPLLQVCREWYNVFLPKVYYSLELHSEQRQLYLLARSLQENPRLGACIHRLWVDCYRDWDSDDDDDEDEEDLELVDDPKTEPFHNLLAKAGPDRRRWQRDLLRDSGDGWMAICLFFLPNLQYFRINYSNGGKTWVPLVLSHIASSGSIDTNPFQKLKEVIIDGIHGHVSRPHSDFLPYFQLPSMQAFCGREITELNEERNNKTNKMLHLAPKSSGITVLALNCTHATIGVTGYITACTNLRVFLYDHTLPKTRDNSPKWRPDIIYNALITQKHSLQVLYIGFSGWYTMAHSWYFIVNDPPARWLGSLQEFTQLREIAIPLGVLVDYQTNKKQLRLSDTLPRSLENLYLGEVDSRDFALVANALCIMMTHRKERFPSLRGIELWFHTKSPPKKDEQWFLQACDAFAPAEKMCRAEDVELHYSHRSESKIRSVSPYLSQFRSLF